MLQVWTHRHSHQQTKKNMLYMYADASSDRPGQPEKNSPKLQVDLKITWPGPRASVYRWRQGKHARPIHSEGRLSAELSSLHQRLRCAASMAHVP